MGSYTRRIRRRRRAPGARGGSGGRRLAVCLILCACALFCKLVWPQSMAAVRDLLTGAEGGRLQRAVSAAAGALPGGAREAAEAFWQGLSLGDAS